MATITRSTGGPLIRVRARPLRVKRGECRYVSMRRMTPGPEHGRWEPISTGGFKVVCPSKLEACELIFLVGGKHFPRPASLIRNDDHDDDRYLDWLLEHYFRIENCRGEVGPFDEEGVCHRHGQVMFWAFLRGWKPGARDYAPGAAGSLIAPALTWAWENR